MATQCRHCCELSFTLSASYRITYLYVILMAPMGLNLVAGLAYAASDLYQCRRMYPRAQLLQLCCAGVIAADSTAVAIAWLAVVAATLHALYATLLCDMLRTGDCRRCCNEAHGCTCGADKDPLEAGTLRTIAACVERLHDARQQRRLRLRHVSRRDGVNAELP